MPAECYHISNDKANVLLHYGCPLFASMSDHTLATRYHDPFSFATNLALLIIETTILKSIYFSELPWTVYDYSWKDCNYLHENRRFLPCNPIKLKQAGYILNTNICLPCIPSTLSMEEWHCHMAFPISSKSYDIWPVAETCHHLAYYYHHNKHLEANGHPITC